jgi:hypothetical protein
MGIVNRGDLARNENGDLGIVIDDHGGLYVGFTFPGRERWTSRAPRSLGSFTRWIATGPHPLPEERTRK